MGVVAMIMSVAIVHMKLAVLAARLVRGRLAFPVARLVHGRLASPVARLVRGRLAFPVARLVHGRLASPVARLVHGRPAILSARLVHREARAGQRIVGVVDAFDGGDGVEPGPREGRDERRLEIGPGVEHRRREHVARDASDGIELDVHGRYCKSPAGTAHSTHIGRRGGAPGRAGAPCRMSFPRRRA